MDNKNFADNEESTSIPKGRSERKNGVFQNLADSHVPDNFINHSHDEDETPPPPYTNSEPSATSPGSCRRVSYCPSEPSNISREKEEIPYTIPKDFSEGLPNPVFTNTPNPDDVDDDPNRKDSYGSIGTKVATFTSLSHYNGNGHYYCQSEFDSEKGPPPFTSSKDFNGIAKNSIISNNNNATKEKSKKEYVGIKRYLGLLLTLSASFCFSMVVLFVKVLKDYGFDAYGASFWRYTGTVIPAIPLLFFYECGPVTERRKRGSIFSTIWPVFKNDNWKTWLGLLSRGLVGSTSVILRYYALQYLTIGDTSVITYSTPVLVTVLAHFFLGERCGVFPIVVAFVTLCGVVIVTKPPLLTGATEFDSNTLIGTGLACGSLFCSALIVIITRKIREVHFAVMTFVFGIIGVAQALTLIYFFGDFNLPTELFDSMLVAGVSCLSFFGQMSIVLALKFEQAGPVALIRSCDVLFGFLLQYIFLHVAPDMFSAIGAAIVLTGVLSTGFRKWLNTLPQDDRRRSRWWFILK